MHFSLYFFIRHVLVMTKHEIYTANILGMSILKDSVQSFKKEKCLWGNYSFYFLYITVWGKTICISPLLNRTQDIKTKKHHIPLVDRTPLEPPPVVVVVMGPPKVGKSTLIRCLIKNYTRQKLSDICGPVTIVSGESVILMNSCETFLCMHSLFDTNYAR